MFHVYVLKNDSGTFHYIGHSHDLSERLLEHNRGKVRSTKAFRPLHVVYTEPFTTKSEAYKREIYLKSAHGNIFYRKCLNLIRRLSFFSPSLNYPTSNSENSFSQ